MKEIKIQLLGIAIILLGIACSLNNFVGLICAIVGFAVVVNGLFGKDKK